VSVITAMLLAFLKPEPSDGKKRLADALARRGLWYRSRGLDDQSGCVEGSFRFDPVSGAAFAAVLDAHVRADTAAGTTAGTAVNQDGEPVEVQDRRTPAQRRADALLRAMGLHPGDLQDANVSPDDRDEPADRDQTADDAAADDAAADDAATDAAAAAAATAAAEAAAAAARPAAVTLQAHVMVIATAEQVDQALTGRRGAVFGLARLETAARTDAPGAFVDAPVLAHLTCLGVLRRVLTAPDGTPVNLGRGVRLATPAQRAAVAVRDGGCAIPGCTVPASRCDVHHDTAWSAGGPTDLDNLIAACGPHHRELHAGIWQIVWKDGIPWVRPPKAYDPWRRLQRNTTFQARHDAARLGEQLTLDHDHRRRPEPWERDTG
jgi:hypothetical protein